MPNAKLLHHNETQFEKTVLELAPGIWGAIGFAASNMYMVECKKTVTIIDTTESTRAAENIWDQFKQKTDKPVGRIIYTHSHRDHISGASIFAPEQDVPVIAHHQFQSDLVAVDDTSIAPNKALGRRTQAQFGIGLSDQERISLGCGPGDRPMEGLGAGHIAPTELITENKKIDLDGVAAELLMFPGETDDHMAVWLPEQKVLFSGDNWYHSFPNLYAIRGTKYRDFTSWARSLGEMCKLDAEVLAPGHTRPVIGREQIKDVLNSTRAAILHVMQQTAEMMDAGKSLNDIAALISLPPELADKPWLGEFYGKVSWSAHAFATGELGWYDGNPTNLGVLSDKQRAEHMAALTGGIAGLRKAAETATDLQWKLELCDHLIALGEDIFSLKARTMVALAEDEINATARNTYLWEAKRILAEQEGETP